MNNQPSENPSRDILSPYLAFLEAKRHTTQEFGIKPSRLPPAMFDFQGHIAEYAIKKGRCAVFLDTGLGKTLIELAVADNYRRATNKPVLIITPLAVAFQFIAEADRFGIDDIEYSKDGKFSAKIVVCNYERLHYFDSSDFDCVILDESSILKNFDGATKQAITTFLKKVPYRFLFTATPSPNDFIELGTSSEALGYLGYTDMLTKFFRNNKNTVKASRVEMANAGAEWYLKPHAEQDFWRWVSGWSISMRKPSDLGFDDSRHILPELIEQTSVVRNDSPLTINGQGSLFNFEATSFAEIKAEVRATITRRCEMAVSKAADHAVTVYWANLNDEAALLGQLDKDAHEIKGAMNLDKKEEILLAFASGEVTKLITKSSITAFGLNWQHCNHTTYFPTYSYEQYYQAIRRFWRFGQTKPVTVDLILSDGQTRIMRSLSAKKDKAIEMFEQLIAHTNESYRVTTKAFDKPLTLPSWIGETK